MSLINQMLKDLESRKGDGGQSRPETLRRGGSSMLPWAITAVLGGVVIVLAVQFWLLQQESRVSNADPAATVPASVENEPVDPATTDDVATRASTTATVEADDAAEQQVATAGTEPGPDPAAGSGNDTDPDAGNDSDDNSGKISDSDTPAASAATAESATPVEKNAASKPATNSTSRQQAAPDKQEERSSTQESVTSADDPVEEGSMVIAPSRLSPREQAESSLQRGFTAMSRRDYSRATDEFQAGLAILPAEDEARMALYQALRRQGRVAEAEGVLETGITDGREPHRFAEQLARNYAARGQVPMAISLLAVAPPGVPADPEYHALWGALLQQQGDYAAARPIYESLVAVEPQNGAWLAGLGVAQQQTGEPQAALASYEAALAAGGLAAAVKEYVTAQVNALRPEEDE